MKRGFLVLTTIILAITTFMLPVSADCEVGRLSAGDVDYKVAGVSDSAPYAPGEQMDLTYHIYPSASGSASDSSSYGIDGNCGISRYYDVYTTLEQSNVSATVTYTSGETETHPAPSDIYERFGNGLHLSFAIPDSGGVEEIKIEVSGYLPSTYSEKLTILSLDVSHAEKGILPPVQLVAVEELDNSTEDAGRGNSEASHFSSTQKGHVEINNISDLTLSIEPSYAEARPGDTINYTVTINWTPTDWRSDLRFCGTLSAAGFRKSFDLQSVEPLKSPPIEKEVPVTLPENIPPLNYTVNLTINAGSLKANDETTLKVNSSTTAITTGFEAVLAVTALTAGLFLIRKRG